MNGHGLDSVASSRLLIAARNADAEIGVFLIVVFGGIILCVVMAAAETKISVVMKNGLPHRPFCGRQVSLRRNWCRACGRDLTCKDSANDFDAEPVAEAEALAAKQAKVARRREELAARERDLQLKACINEKAREEQRRRSDEYWIQRGIEPGPFAWWRSFPDWVRIIVATLTVAVSLATVILKMVN